MNFIKKFLAAMLTAILFLTLPAVTSAEVKEFSAEGEYRLGDNDTRASAKIKALDDAKRKIAEQIGVYVQSFSEMNKSELTTDLIRTAAIAMIKVKAEKVEYSETARFAKFLSLLTPTLTIKILPKCWKKLNANRKTRPIKKF